MNINEYIKKYSEKLGIDQSEVQNEFDKLVIDEKSRHPTLDDDKRNMIALRRLAIAYKQQLKSPAVNFEGMIFAATDPINFNAKKIKMAEELFRENPQEAVLSGATTEDGTPLDNIVVWASGTKNSNFGKPLARDNWNAKIFGVAKNKDGDIKPFLLNANNELAQKVKTLPMFQAIQFRALDKSQPEDDKFTLNTSTVTKFNINADIDMPNAEVLIKNYCSNMLVNINELNDYHDAEKDNWDRLAIIEGDVSMITIADTYKRLILEDESQLLEDLDADGLNCWVPQHLNFDFGEGSKIFLFGRTSQGFKKDENGNKTDELGAVSINTFGMYALPEFKIDVEVEEVTEENLDVAETTPQEKTEEETTSLDDVPSVPNSDW